MLPPVRQLVPEYRDDVDVAALVAAEARPRPVGRPWVLVNMVASVDGAVTIDDRSGGLGGAGDHRLFHALRGAADTILVGAGTARAEDYGPARTGARIAVVTGRADLDPGARLFRPSLPSGQPAPPVWVLVPASAPADRVARLAEVAEVVTVGVDRVDVLGAVAALGERGASVVLCEGGPTLNGQLLAAGVVDEWRQTYAPKLVAGSSPRGAVSEAPLPAPVGLSLASLLEEDGELYARYLRTSVVNRER